METSFSAFPIIIQEGLGQSQRNAQSTLIRAHAMARYHHQQRTSKSNNGSSCAQFLSHVDPEENGPSKLLVQKPPVVKKTAFVEYEAPLVSISADRRSSKIKKKSISVCSRRRPSEMGIVSVKGERSLTHPGVSQLQLNDPRVRQYPIFMEVFTNYFELLERRQTDLDPMSKSWLPTAFSDLALFHAILFNFSQQLFALCSVDHEKPELLMHKVDAIRQISGRLDTQNQSLACTDAVIASILCLISHELLKADYPALQAHMCGLRQIIKIRGGVDMLGLDGTLKTVYLNYELLLQTIFNSWTTNLPPLPAVICTNGYGAASQQSFGILSWGCTLSKFESCCFNEEVLQIFQSLEYMFADVYNTSASESSSKIQEILSKLYETGETIFSDGDDTISNHAHASLQLAITLHCSTLESSTPKDIERLKYHLNETSLQSCWIPFPGALLYCLIIGTSAATSTPYRPWFVANFIRATTRLAFGNWEGLRECLHRFAELGIVD